MKRQILTLEISIFIILLIPLFLFGGDFAKDKLDLKLRLKPGQKYDMRLTTELKRKNESFMFAKGMGFEVKEVDTNGVASMEVTFRTLQVNIIREGFRCEYDSTKQSIADDYSKIPKIEAASVGETFVIKLTPKGEIIEVKDLEEMYSRIFEKVEEWNEKYLIMEMVPCKETEKSCSSKTTRSPTTLSWKEMSESNKKVRREVRMHNIKATYSKKEIENMLSDMIISFPSEPLAVGDSWEDKVKIWTNAREIEGNYTLKGIEKGTLTIDLTAKRTPEEEPFSWVNNEGREVGFKLVGYTQGSFEVDQQTGWLLRSKVKNVFTGKVVDKEAEDKEPQTYLEEELITVEPLGDRIG